MSVTPDSEHVHILTPEWPAPPGVRAAFTLRSGGVSAPPFDSLNLGAHVGDEAEAVAENRRRLRTQLRLPEEPAWMEQVHGIDVLDLDALAHGAPPVGLSARMPRLLAAPVAFARCKWPTASPCSSPRAMARQSRLRTPGGAGSPGVCWRPPCRRSRSSRDS